VWAKELLEIFGFLLERSEFLCAESGNFSWLISLIQGNDLRRFFSNSCLDPFNLDEGEGRRQGGGRGVEREVSSIYFFIKAFKMICGIFVGYLWDICGIFAGYLREMKMKTT